MPGEVLFQRRDRATPRHGVEVLHVAARAVQRRHHGVNLAIADRRPQRDRASHLRRTAEQCQLTAHRHHRCPPFRLTPRPAIPASPCRSRASGNPRPPAQRGDHRGAGNHHSPFPIREGVGGRSIPLAKPVVHHAERAVRQGQRHLDVASPMRFAQPDLDLHRIADPPPAHPWLAALFAAADHVLDAVQD